MSFIDDVKMNKKLQDFGLFVSTNKKGNYLVYFCSKHSNSKVIVAKFRNRMAYERGLVMGILALGSLKPKYLSEVRKSFDALCSFVKEQEEILNEKVSF